MRFQFWDGNGSWRGYKATTILITSGIAKAILDNYWVFTSVPLADEGNSIIAKFFYLVAQIAFTSILFGGVGLTIDYLRSIFQLQADETSALTNRPF